MSVSELKDFRPLLGAEPEEFGEHTLRSYLDAFVMDAEEFEFIRPERSLKNPNIVEYVCTEPGRTVTAHTCNPQGNDQRDEPPCLNRHLHGLERCPEHSVLLFITVPGGIIIVSSAAGLANALSAGLSRS